MMAKLEEFTDSIIAVLRQAGLTVFAEYEKPLVPLPDKPFLTAAPRKFTCGEPLPYTDGIAMPAALTLSLRLHSAVAEKSNTLAETMEQRVIPVLVQQGYDMRSVEMGAPEYVRALDRMVCEAVLVIGGLFFINDDENQ